MARCMTWRGHRGDPWCHFLIGVVRRDLQSLHHLLYVGELRLVKAIGLALIGIVGPERGYDGWHLDFRIREGGAAIGVLQSTDMIAMEMRDEDDVDLLGIDTRRFHIAARLTHRALAAGKRSQTIPGVNRDELRA